MNGISGTQEALLSLTSAALFGGPVSLPAAVDWQGVLREAFQQAVLPIAFSAAEPYLLEAELPLWRRRAQHLLAKNMRVQWEHIELHRLMAAQGIPYVVMKGSASAAYYPAPMLRSMGDVDFLVPAEETDRALEAVKDAGFTPVRDREHTFHIACHRDAVGGLTSVWELHWAVGGIPDGEAGDVLRDKLSDLLNRAELRKIEGGCCRVPSPFHHGLILLLHTAGHMIGEGIGLRHLCDWAVFVDSLSDEEFTGMFEETLRAAGLWRFAGLLTAVAARYLNCRARPWAAVEDETLLEAVMEDILTGGNFGKKDPERINEAKLMTNGSRGTVDDTGMLRQLCYSMNDKARIALPAAKRHPILLPAGWIYVGGRHLLRVLTGRRPKIHIRKMVRGAAERREIYREFRLFEAERDEGTG